MKLPHVYKGYSIVAKKSKASGKWVLYVTHPDHGLPIKSYIPPLQVIYLGYTDPPYAYDHDIEHLQEWIDCLIYKNQHKPA